MEWAVLNERRLPQLKLLHHIPNGGYRPKAAAGRLKAMGVRAGIPDLNLPVPSRDYIGLWIEMKAATGKVKREQRLMMEALRAQGHFVGVCRSWEEAAELIEYYLTGRVSSLSTS